MKPRTLLTVALGAFVAASVVHLALGGRPARAPGGASGAEAAPAGARVVAYYFHATMRCPTCLAIESGARATIEREFPAQLAEGSLVWRPLDMEAEGNEHFVKDFELTASSLVLVREVDGRTVAWRNLADVWTLVGDDARFADYVAANTRALIEAS